MNYSHRRFLFGNTEGDIDSALYIQKNIYFVQALNILAECV